MHPKNKSIEALTRGAIAVFFCSLIGAGACVDRGSEEATAEEALVALSDAEVSCGDVVDQALECLTGLKSCVDQARTAEDLDACKAEIEGCVPPPPPPPSEDGEQPDGDCPKPSPDGEQPEQQPPPPPPDGEQQPPPPPPDGEQQPPPSTDGQPPPPPRDGERPSHHGGSKHIENPCVPGGPVVGPCVADLTACLETSTDRGGCFSAAQVCLQTSIEAKLTALCDAALAQCAESDGSEEACADIAARCSSSPAR